MKFPYRTVGNVCYLDTDCGNGRVAGDAIHNSLADTIVQSLGWSALVEGSVGLAVALGTTGAILLVLFLCTCLLSLLKMPRKRRASWETGMKEIGLIV